MSALYRIVSDVHPPLPEGFSEDLMGEGGSCGGGGLGLEGVGGGWRGLEGVGGGWRGLEGVAGGWRGLEGVGGGWGGWGGMFNTPKGESRGNPAQGTTQQKTSEYMRAYLARSW